MNTSLTKSCSFFGHRELNITDNLKSHLKATLEYLISTENFDTFYFGGLGSFDELCYKTISDLKLRYPHIKRIFCLYDLRHTRESKRPAYLKNQEYEEYVYLHLNFDYWYTRIYYRNCEIIKQSDFINFYVQNSENSGAYKTMQYAIKNKKGYLNLAT